MIDLRYYRTTEPLFSQLADAIRRSIQHPSLSESGFVRFSRGN